MTPDPYALSRLLRSTGKSAREIVAAYNAAHPLAPLSSPNVESWMRPPGASRKPTRPRWDVLAGLADALNIPRRVLYAACAGEDALLMDLGGMRSRLIALTADETPVELCYHPDGDDGSGNGWLLIVGDRTVAVGTLDKVLNAS